MRLYQVFGFTKEVFSHLSGLFSIESVSTILGISQKLPNQYKLFSAWNFLKCIQAKKRNTISAYKISIDVKDCLVFVAMMQCSISIMTTMQAT
jgi:hypothetical protein